MKRFFLLTAALVAAVAVLVAVTLPPRRVALSARENPAETASGVGRLPTGRVPISPVNQLESGWALAACVRLDGGLKSPLQCLTQARYGISWGALGAAMACYDEAVRYAKNRVMFDRPIGGTQIQQVRLADMLTEITKAQLLCVQLGRMKERGTAKPEQVSLAKRNNCEIALDIARRARDILGANGITAEYPVMRHMCNLESVKTYEGTHNIHTLVLGEAVTGLQAYR